MNWCVLVPPSIFRIRTVWIGCAILFISFFQVVSLSVLVPYGMQTLDGIRPDQAALNLITFSLAVPVGAFVSGRWMLHSGRYKPLQLIGTGLLPLAMLLLAYVGPHATLTASIALMLAGVATGMTMPTSLVAVQNAVAQKNIGIATAMTALCRSMGGAIGVAVLSSILFALLHGEGHGAMLETGAAAVTGLAGGAGGTEGAGAEASFAFRMTFFCGALVALIAHALAWRIPEASLRGHAEAAAGNAEN